MKRVFLSSLAVRLATFAKRRASPCLSMAFVECLLPGMTHQATLGQRAPEMPRGENCIVYGLVEPNLLDLDTRLVPLLVERTHHP